MMMMMMMMTKMLLEMPTKMTEELDGGHTGRRRTHCSADKYTRDPHSPRLGGHITPDTQSDRPSVCLSHAQR